VLLHHVCNGIRYSLKRSVAQSNDAHSLPFPTRLCTEKNLPSFRICLLGRAGALIAVVTSAKSRAFGSQPKGWCFSRSGNRSEHFRRYFAMGKIRGTPYMRSHIFVHRATTKYFSNSFVFKTEIEKEGLPGDITPALGAGGPRFDRGAPTKSIFRLFFNL